MCGIVGGVAQRNVSSILIEGLKRLEYRGYDSAGMAIIDDENALQRIRSVGKVSILEQKLQDTPLLGATGIAHTRWATHGRPTENNAHPHISKETFAVVHNGIIENFESLRASQLAKGYIFSSQTDTEVIVHCVHSHYQVHQDLLQAVWSTVQELEGAFALAVIDKQSPGRMIAVRKGSPLVIGVGIGEHFIASDYMALLPVTQKFIVLEEGDIADIQIKDVHIFDAQLNPVERTVQVQDVKLEVADRGEYRHFMLKEIFQQPDAIRATTNKLINESNIDPEIFGRNAADILTRVEHVHLVACGTSYHAGCLAKYWIESEAGIPCSVEIASEYRYRDTVVPKNSLFVTLSQSGETADTLAALRKANTSEYLATFGICNVPGSSLMRESQLVFRTKAGPEIGVASTKAFTTQLVSLLGLTLALANVRGREKTTLQHINALMELPLLIKQTLDLDEPIQKAAELLGQANSALFLGRGQLYPIALEGALKLKEISYIHAEAYPAGELKHGPLALVDKNMPVIAIGQNDALIDKLKSNLQEVKARGGKLILFLEQGTDYKELGDDITVIQVPKCPSIFAPILHTIPLQLLSYYVAVMKGTDVDQPRNLAKSVTVE